LTPTAAASELLSEPLECAIQEGIYSLAHGLGAAAVKNIDSHLIESHQRPHPHAAGNEHLHPVLGQVIYRSHASALLMGHVGQSPDLLHSTIRDFDHGIEIAVAEMGAQGCIKPTRMGRGNRNNGTFHHILLNDCFSIANNSTLLSSITAVLSNTPVG
jgi:hypothetical protein